MNAPDANRCPECGVPLREYWPQGFCPKCSFDGALATESEKEKEGKGEVGIPTQRPSDSRSPFPLSPSSRRFGDFELLEEIGRGGMGVIYRARQISLNRIVALKMILAGQFARKEEVLRFRSEAEAAANLQHPNIVRIHETGERDGHHYFSMDCVEGRTLSEIVRDGPLPAQRAAKYVRRIAEAIHYAHTQGVLHRDLKPSNVVIDANDEPRITDFGLAKRMRNDFGVTVTGQVLGSPNFMPPEQTSAKSGEVGPASDVYGAGAILYCLLTGRPPFHAETIEELLLLLRDAEPVSPRLLNLSVPRDLETICLKCLEKDPARRYTSAQALADELGRFIHDEPIHARPLPFTGKIWRWCRRRPAIAALSASVLLLLIAIASSSSIAAWRVSRARTSEQRAVRELRHTVSLLELERAEDYFNANDAAFGVAHLAAMLRRDPSNAIAANRLVSAIVHRGWARPATPVLRHRERVISAVFSPDKQRVLTVSRDNTARLWNAATGQPIVTMRHGSVVNCAQFNRAGDRIVTASASGTAQVWDAMSGERLGPRLRHGSNVYWAEFSTDGRWIVTACHDSVARVWDASNGTLKRELRKHTSVLTFARFSPDGKRIATGGSRGSIRIWNADSGEMLLRVEDRAKPLTALAFSPDGQKLLVACDDGIVRLWNAETGEMIGEPITHGKQWPIWHAAFSPDSKLLLTLCENGTARLWDAQTTHARGESLRHESGVVFGGFSPDGEMIVTTSSDNTARVWDVDSGKPLCQPLRHIGKVSHASFSADGRRIVTASYDDTARVWELREPVSPVVRIHPGINVLPMSFSPDGNALLTTAQDKILRLSDARTGEALIEPITNGSFVTPGEFSPDGNRMAIGYADGTVRLWDCSAWKSGHAAKGSAQLVMEPIRTSNQVQRVRFGPDGSRIVTALADGTAQIWDTMSGRMVTPPLKHSRRVTTARFSPDGRFVATASEDRTARVWDAQSGQPVTGPLAHADHVKWVEFSPDGTLLLTASTDNTACIWDVRTGQKRTTLFHTRIVERAAFSPDGRKVATASLDQTASIWDVRTGQPLAPPLRHDSRVDWVFFTSDGERVITACASSQARFWDAATGRPLSEWLNAGGTYWGASFSPASERVAVGVMAGSVRIWQMPRAPTPVPDWFPKFAESLAGIHLGPRGSVELVAPDGLNALLPPVTNTHGFYEALVSKLSR